jgi:DNA-binding transcriptional regulator YiaG
MAETRGRVAELQGARAGLGRKLVGKVFLTCLLLPLHCMDMSISGDEIRAARERAQMTQEELAERVGVKMRTIGNWERGVSVPRSRMAAVEEVLAGFRDVSVGMNSKQLAMLEHLGAMAARRRNMIGLAQDPFAAEIGVADQTVKKFERGKQKPQSRNAVKLEAGLGWRQGVIRESLELAELGRLSVADVDEEYLDGHSATNPVVRASELSDAELLAEVIGRLQGWAARLGDDPVKVESADNEAFDLAARALKGIKGDDAP